MEEEKIDVVKKWPKPESVRDIQVSIGFANFYQRFIKSFSRIVAPLIAMLKTTRSSIASAFKVDHDEVVGDGGAVREDVIGWLDASKKLAKSKSQTKSGNSNNWEESKFLTSEAKKSFNHLRHAFTKALIL